MTLTTVPRYDRDAVDTVGDHAVVVGASMAGLLAGRVLADGFESVTVVERDSLPDEPTTRRGVPQGDHVHALQEAGRATLEDLFPGYSKELLSAGGLLVDTMSDFQHYEKGGFLADGETRMPMYSATRPLLEQVVRRRLAAIDSVTLRTECRQVDYLTNRDGTAVTGVELRDDGGRDEVAADLVVDATGRTSQTAAWLGDNGYESPTVDEVHIDIAYSTISAERPTGDHRAFFVPPDPPRTRGAGVFPVEDGHWVVTFAGVHGDHPPTDPAELRAFAATLPVPELAEIVDEQELTEADVAHYPFPSNRRRRFEALDRFPDGLVVTGDALCSFNPIYGQGMSVAALEALVLHHTLASAEDTGFGLRFFEAVEPIVDVPWSIAVGGDFEFPSTTGPKPRGTDLFNRYIARLMRQAHSDWRLREALVRVFMMETPPSTLLRPTTAWRVLKPTRSDVETLSTRPFASGHWGRP
ncbi:FAD-dependent monooxygenase [Halomicroarcula sp. S1AR25-4]|uniref:FAD-dependent oxidoreductase n=1 Tax=Haloarcula sp. S1AR25-4 TaxID=2950538 RepID=UPI002876E640|nr:FAD-dependent monooxygenase [Halomicroarcula sp. S1AR25-4]MDS0277419.1 FAD-dependent monooxygenase [Halomicroarcula sp. S1AR25-4]